MMSVAHGIDQSRPNIVMPAQAGIHDFRRRTGARKVVDARLRGHDVDVMTGHIHRFAK